MKPIVVLMGVSGSGKTTVGQTLANQLGVPFYDGDDFHPPQNIAKMAQGIPLDDDDRAPWLAALQRLITNHGQRGESAVIACSALKKTYRDQLRQGSQAVCIVYLQGSPTLIRERLAARQAHFMKADMWQSQFESLEPPSPHNTLILNADQSVDDLVQQILQTI